jgi:hypothetical protein
VEDPDHSFDFSGLRLDWCRLQSYISATGPAAGGKGSASQFDLYKANGMARSGRGPMLKFSK